MDYWEKRQLETYKAGEMKVNQYFTKLEKAFNQTKRELQKTVESFYWRYAEENGLSYAAAQIRLNKEELGELQDFIDLSMKNIGKHSQIVNNLSIKARITRYQALEAQVDALLRQLYAVDYQDAAEQMMLDVYEESYYQTWYNIDQYRGFHVAFAQVDATAVEELLKYPFNGANFSSRLWKQKDHLQAQLMESITTMMVQGKNPQVLAGDFAKKMQSKKFDAYRLLHTESSFLMSEAAHAGYREDGVEKYQILATLDSKTCGICGDKDGDIHEVDKAVVGDNMPPFHCFCRCADVPYYDDMDLTDMSRMARDPETGRTYEVPADMTYPEWKKRYVPKSEKAGASGIKRTSGQMEKRCIPLRTEAEKYSPRKSRWSGKVRADNERCEQEGCLGIKEWNCDIIVRDDVPDGIMLHELLHSCSASYHSPADYIAHQGIEEASVELLTQEIAEKMGIAHIPGYTDTVGILRNLNNGLGLYESDMEFAKELFKHPMTERFSWLQDKVNGSIIHNEKVSVDEAAAIMDYVDKLGGGSVG